MISTLSEAQILVKFFNKTDSTLNDVVVSGQKIGSLAPKTSSDYMRLQEIKLIDGFPDVNIAATYGSIIVNNSDRSFYTREKTTFLKNGMMKIFILYSKKRKSLVLKVN